MDWTHEDIETLRRYHANMTNREVAQLMAGRFTIREITQKASKLGLLKSKEQRTRSSREAYRRFPRRST